MTHVVAEPCFNCKYTDCVTVCPVECFYEGEAMLFIHPDECIDCEACVPECPPLSIFHEDNLPEEWAKYKELNAEMAANCPSITERLEPMGPPINKGDEENEATLERRGEGKHFVAYHNTEKMGHEFTSNEFVAGIEWDWSTKKIPEQFVGGKIWCVSASGKPRNYFLHGWFSADTPLDSDDESYPFLIAGKVGYAFPTPIRLNELDWFSRFLKSQSNFSLGLQSIAPEFVEHLESLIPDEDGIDDLFEETTDLSNDVEKSRTESQSQGFSISAEDRKLTEEYAVLRAERHFLDHHFHVEHHGKKFDLKCTKPGVELFVEVKGTSTAGESILLTPNEVEFARQNQPSMALFIVHSIELTGIGKHRQASGGVDRVINPWIVDEHGDLFPSNFTYRITSDDE